MSIVLRILSFWAHVCLSILMGILRVFFFWTDLYKWLDSVVTPCKKELRAVDLEEARVMEKLRGKDQLLYYTHNAWVQKHFYNSAGGEANYNFWQVADPVPYANLYRKGDYTPAEVEAAMAEARMATHFKKSIRELLR